jgi:pilus assembly protein CpaC
MQFSFRPRALQLLLYTAAAICLSEVQASPAFAQLGPAGAVNTPSSLPPAIGLGVGAQNILEVGNVTRVAIGDPRVADVSLVGGHQLRILGLAPGATDIVIWRGNTQQRVRVSVAADLDGVRAMSAADPSLAGARIGSENGRVVVSGTVPDLEAHRRLMGIARPAGSNSPVTDLTRITGDLVVAVEVKFAAVSASRLRSLGVNFRALGSNFSAAGAPPSTAVPSLSASTIGVGTLASPIAGAFNLLFSTDGGRVLGALSVLTSTDYAQVLAEPTLIVRSGEHASFLAGGEIPVPVPQGSLGVTTVTIDYKPFGVRLDVSPTVMSPGRILLRVSPEVSELDYSNAVTLQGFSVPAFRKRSTSTAVELADGQSIVLAGLSLSTTSQLDERIPAIGELPVIGALFGRSRAQRDAQELVIIATPRLVRPMQASAVPPLPGSRDNQTQLPNVGDIILQRNTASDAAGRFGLIR